MKKFSPAELTVLTGRSWNTRELPVAELELCFDSRQFAEGKLFWPIVGESFDAHDFIEPLLEKGMEFFAAHKVWLINQPNIPGYCLSLDDSVKDLGRLASNYAQTLKAIRIAITGSNGKTTTKEMLKAVLGENTLATKGNLNNHIGVPFTLLELDAEHDFAIVEAGTNHPGEIAYLSELIQPHIALITNVGDSHLEYLLSRQGVYEEKRSLQNYLQENGLVIVCADDPYLNQLVPKAGSNLITYGIEKGHLRPEALIFDEQGRGSFLIESVEFSLQAPGRHNVLNALAAIAIGRYLNLPLAEMAMRLREWKPGMMRSEFENVAGITLYKDCYNSNPSSVAAALQVMAANKNCRRKLLVMGDMFELGDQSRLLHKAVASQIMEAKLDKVYLSGIYCKDLYQSLIERGYRNAKHYENNEEIANALIAEVENEDLVLFKASRGMKFDQIINLFKEAKV